MRPTFSCLRCGATWRPLTDVGPIRCGVCRSPYWDIEPLKARKKVTAKAKSLKEAVKMVKISSKDLAGIVGVNRTYVSSILNGKRHPTQRLAMDIANVLEVEFDSVFRMV